MATKYPLHREYVEKMLRDQIDQGITKNEQGDWLSLIDELVDDGYLANQVGMDLQAYVTEKTIG